MQIFLPSGWWRTVSLDTKVEYGMASNERITIYGIVLLVVSLGDLGARPCFGVVENLAVPILICRSYIDVLIQEYLLWTA